MKDYDRTVCKKCNTRKKCEGYRSEFWCHICEFSLICIIDGNINNKQCRKIKQGWRTLPRKCVLVDKIIGNYITTATHFRDTTNFYTNGYNMRICPRCLQPAFVMYACGDSIKKRLLYWGGCHICNVCTKQPVIRGNL